MHEETPLVQDQHPSINQSHPNFKSNLDNEREATKFYCTKCQQVQQSKVDHQIGSWTFICCGIWCLVSLVGGLIPFCLNPCKDAVQHCSVCNEKVGEAPFKPC